MEKISKAQLKNIIKSYFSDAKTDHEKDYAYKSLLFYVKKKVHLFDDDAIELISKIGDALIEQVEKTLDVTPDGESRRKMKRQIDLTKGEHYSFEATLQNLYQDPKTDLEIYMLTENLFIKLGQTALDYLHDIPRKGIRKDESITLTLFHSAIDELLVAFHLAQHGFAPQSLHHSRTVLEILDMVELFRREKKWVFFWDNPSISQRKKWDKLSPSKVRKELGKKAGDDVYSFLAEIGTHVTSHYIKPKFDEEVIDLVNKKMSITIKLGGSSQNWAIVAANSAAIHSSMLLLAQIANNFKQYLSEEEVINKILEVTEDYKKYFLDGFVKYSREKELDTTQVEDYIRKIKIDL